MLKASLCRIIAISSLFLPSPPRQSVVKTVASPFKTFIAQLSPLFDSQDSSG